MKIAYWVTTVLICLMMLASAGMYLFNTPEVAKIFTELGFPVWVIYPLAIAKILAVVAILTNKSYTLREWAYAGLFFDFVLAAMAHHHAGHDISGLAPSLVAIVLLLVSYNTTAVKEH